uniref:Uncharacterized protein n=1 Tax=Zooxanthella nutricula TaxID=1333877 RepID=A0A6U8WXA0_9DINO
MAAAAWACLAAALLQVIAAEVMVVPTEVLRHGLRGPALMAPGRSLLLFDCKADYLDWVRGWSDAKRDYCCQRSGLSCEKAAERQRSQANSDFDCDEGLVDWEMGWSAGKQSWCCTHRSKGCAAAGARLHDVPALQVKAALPAPAGDGPFAMESPGAKDFECEINLADITRVWSQDKKDYCCRAKGIGCLNIAV